MLIVLFSDMGVVTGCFSYDNLFSLAIHFFKLFIYLFIWLHQVLVAACGIFIAACGLLSSCGTWAQ